MDMNEFMNIIKHLGGKAYYVGGSVRDEIIGRNIKDIDITITGVSRESFEEYCPDLKLISDKFSVYKIMIDDKYVEVSLARRDIKVSIGHDGFKVDYDKKISIEEDLYRRDITINAMAREISTGELVDPYGGIKDIKKKQIKAVSRHFAEDSLRALRAARFAAILDYDISDDTFSLMAKCKDEIRLLSQERIVCELERALSGDRPSIYFRELKKADILEEAYRYVSENMSENAMRILDEVSRDRKDISIRFIGLIYGLLTGKIGKNKRNVGFLENIRTDFIRLLNRVYPAKWRKTTSFIITNINKITEDACEDDILSVLEAVNKGICDADDIWSIMRAARNDREITRPRYLYNNAAESVFAKIDIPEGVNGPEKIKEYVRTIRIMRIKDIISMSIG